MRKAMVRCPYCGSLIIRQNGDKSCISCKRGFMMIRTSPNGIWTIGVDWYWKSIDCVVGIVRDNRPVRGRVKRQGRERVLWVVRPDEGLPEYIPHGKHIPIYVTRKVRELAMQARRKNK